MKYLLFALLWIASLSITSCVNNDDINARDTADKNARDTADKNAGDTIDNIPRDTSVVGSWISTDQKTYEGDIYVYKNTIFFTFDNNYNAESTVTKNGQLEKGENEITAGTYKINEDRITINTSLGMTVGTYSINDNKLSIKFDADQEGVDNETQIFTENIISCYGHYLP